MKYLVAFILFLAVATPFAAERVHLDSRLKDRDIAIDGDSRDWAGPFVPLGDQHPVAVAVANDRDNLYLAMTASDSEVRRQVLRQGLIVWFDPGGKEKKHFGIKFPVGVLPSEPERGRSRPLPPAPGTATEVPPEFEEPVRRLEVLGPGKDDAHSFVIDRAPGISVRVAAVEGSLVYELKVPLEPTSELPYAVGARPGTTIGLGLETPKTERPEEAGRGRGMGGFGGGGGMGGRPGGMGVGGREGRGEFQPTKPMKVWATVKLAS